MLGQQKLLSLWVCLLIMAAFCPGAQYVHSKRRGGFPKFGGKSSTNKGSTSQGSDLSKQGLKLAGAAAAAGVLGGTGYGLGHKSRSHHKPAYYDNPQGFLNKTQWRTTTAGAPAPYFSITLGYVLSFLAAVWIRGM